MIDFTNPQNKVLIYADNAFSLESRKQFPLRAKVADGYIRYAHTAVVGVVDTTTHEQNVGQILGIRDDIPMFSSLTQAIDTRSPNILLIGTAPSGGDIDQSLLDDIRYTIERGVHIMNGMHYALNANTDISQLAQEYSVSIWDVRIPEHEDFPVASCRAYGIKKPILLTCAADAAIGKMTVGFELEKAMHKRGLRGEMLATGQTAMMITGKGISIDRVIGDFMPGAVEQLVIEADPDDQFLIIEGQGGLLHPGYAPVTLALLHGGMPTHAILVVRPQRKHSIGSKLIKLPSVQETMHLYQACALPIRPVKFIGIALHSAGLSEEEMHTYIRTYADETGLPVEDVIRYPSGALADAFEKEILSYQL